MSSSDYQAAQTENLRNPKNRFLGLFCHANQVDDHWGCNWSFGCGVALFSCLVGIWTIFDAVTMCRLMTNQLRGRTGFTVWCIIRFLSDFIAIIAMIFAILSVRQINFKRATIGYYMLIVSLILNTAFVIYCITCFFDSYFWRATTFRIIIWLLNEFVLFIFCWILFCNMVDIGRKKRNAAASNPF